MQCIRYHYTWGDPCVTGPGPYRLTSIQCPCNENTIPSSGPKSKSFENRQTFLTCVRKIVQKHQHSIFRHLYSRTVPRLCASPAIGRTNVYHRHQDPSIVYVACVEIPRSTRSISGTRNTWLCCVLLRLAVQCKLKRRCKRSAGQPEIRWRPLRWRGRSSGSVAWGTACGCSQGTPRFYWKTSRNITLCRGAAYGSRSKPFQNCS